ncbi:MAG TPA: DUF4097 family beta strand repeat-containing protein, partial [Gemmatimonadota bacterium]|nr:DUF4097 family beta strand repeat-containing protein [Gemmatimonadota bacterium]
SADAELETGSGGIDVQGRVGGDLRARTGSGSVSAGAVGGQSVDVRTGSGGIRLGPLAAGRVVLHSGSGSVTARLERSPSSLRVDTGSGGVDLELPGDASADLDIETGSGGVRVDFPFQLVSSGRNHVRGTLGGGGPEYTIRTGSGEVHLSKAAGGSGG